MSYLSHGGERFTLRGTQRSAEVQHPCESGGVRGQSCGCHPQERPAPEGAGGSPRWNMCQRATDRVPSFRSLRGPGGDRITCSTLHRGTASPGFGKSDRKVLCCEKCSATLVSLKKQALSLAVHHHFSCKDSGDLSAFLRDNLRVHSRSTAESRERDREQGQCGSCGVNLDQLKEEAAHLALNRGQPSVKPSFEPGLSAGRPLGQSETKSGDVTLRQTAAAGHEPRSQTHSPQSPRTPQRTPQTLRRRGPRLLNPDMNRWVEEQQQLVASATKTGSMFRSEGVSSYTYNQSADEAPLCHGDTGTIQTTSKIPHLSKVVNIANSAAMSFLARAAEKLSLTLKKKGQTSHSASAHLSTCFREMIQKNPPPVPSCLLQAVTKTKLSPSVAKLKVVLRVNPTLPGGQPVLRIDPSKKRVTVMEPICKSQTHTEMAQGRQGKSLLKTFTFDAVYPQDSSQAEVCAGVLTDVIRCVVSGSNGCVLGLGYADVGSWSSMVGNDESIQKLGLIPCAISWLYSTIERRREKTWTDLIVSVSAIELCCGEDDVLRDLLGEVVPSSANIQDSPAAYVSLHEDPVYGIQLRKHNRVKAQTAERAASLLDAAIAARRHGDIATPLAYSSIMFFTLHVQPPRTECSTIGKGSRRPSKLTLIDVCSGHGKSKHPHSELGPVILSLLSGHNTTHNIGSKLSMLLREALGHVNCHTTIIAQVSDSLAHLQEVFSTIQLASRIRRTQQKAKQSTSCSPCGRSLSKEKIGTRSLSLRAFHSTGEVNLDIPHVRLPIELDERSNSDQSCDTVIKMDSNGLVQHKVAPILELPKFVPIIPSLHPNKADMDDPEFVALLQELLKIPQLRGEKKKEENIQGHTEVRKEETKQPERDCLKCDTFAELQERLDCIDGSETNEDVIKPLTKVPVVGNITTKPHLQKDAEKQTDTDSSVPQQTVPLNPLGCSQTSVGEKQPDGTFPGDNFQREDSGLYDCEECGATSSSEELLNQTHTLSKTSQTPEVHDPRTVNSGNKVSPQKCDLDPHTVVVPSLHSVAPQLSGNQGIHEASECRKPDKRTSPVGMSSPTVPSTSHSVNTSVIPYFPKEEVKEVKATITVTVQQPLDHKGQDELVFSMVEEVTISGATDRVRTGGNIICIRDASQSIAHDQVSASSQPIRIISNVNEENTGCSNIVKSSVVPESNMQKPQYQILRENQSLPSFINPMLIHTDTEYGLDNIKESDNPCENFTGVKSRSDLIRNQVKCLEDGRALEENSAAFASDLPLCRMHYNTTALENSALYCDAVDNKMCLRRSKTTGRNQPRDREPVYCHNTEKVSMGAGNDCRLVGKAPERTGNSPGCQETTFASFETTSLTKGWQTANHQDSCNGDHIVDGERNPIGVTSSTPNSPRVTLERRQGRHDSANNSFHVPSGYRQEASSLPRKGLGSLFEASSLSRKHNSAYGRSKTPIEESSRLFSAKLDQVTRRMNATGRIPVADFSTVDRHGSNTSISSRGSSKGSTGDICTGGYKASNGRDSTIPRASRSFKKNPRSTHVDPFFASEHHLPHSLKSTHCKLSAVGKLKMVSPKHRRLSAPNTKNLTLSHKGLQQSINRSASLSSDGKTVSFERTSSFLSSSPPRSHQFLSRTPSQSSTCSSTKSVIQGFFNSRISDLPLEKVTSPPSAGLDKMSTHSSPYSQVTVPRTPTHLSGNASDTTSVLSGDLPPAMGKTLLHFSQRNSIVSSGYGSMMRDSEATGSSTSNRDSVSDKSGSVLSADHSTRTSQRRGNTGLHQHHLSHDTSPSMRHSASGLRDRWEDRSIPESYEIKVYEIDNVQRMQKRAGAHASAPS
ncbi:kinesin-like protein KIF26B isoform X1 [Thalassophryne amazonica]|uniref:kinesin-like protein KIF26B isoform X1 n=1 Tax=Thalassophryne amazonica TaxID=390379 RepID=UPI0014709F46|nr:kinesin-like protein KIF26B isoform X1 [Thalassophryne amazonica]